MSSFNENQINELLNILMDPNKSDKFGEELVSYFILKSIGNYIPTPNTRELVIQCLLIFMKHGVKINNAIDIIEDLCDLFTSPSTDKEKLKEEFEELTKLNLDEEKKFDDFMWEENDGNV